MIHLYHEEINMLINIFTLACLIYGITTMRIAVRRANVIKRDNADNSKS